MWKENGYQSCNFEISSEDDSDDSQSERAEREEEEEATVDYVVGDVTHPQQTNDNNAIVVHVIGKMLTSFMQSSFIICAVSFRFRYLISGDCNLEGSLGLMFAGGRSQQPWWIKCHF